MRNRPKNSGVIVECYRCYAENEVPDAEVRAAGYRRTEVAPEDNGGHCGKGCGHHLDAYWKYCPACGSTTKGHAVGRKAAPLP